MIDDRRARLAAALDEWRVRGAEHNWRDVLERATARELEPSSQVPRRAQRPWAQRRRMALAVVALAIAAPSIAAVSGSVSWPWKRLPGARLGASVPSLPGTTFYLRSHGGLIVRTDHGVNFMSRKPARQRRHFAWEIRTKVRISAASVVLPAGPLVHLCSPCGDRQSGAFNLAGTRALDFLNGRATLRLTSNGKTVATPVRLTRLR